MSQFDFKKAMVYIRDGYTLAAGAINNGAGYAAGASVLTVDGFTTAVPVGTRISIAGHADPYIVTASTGTPATSITVSPVLTASVLDDVVITVLPHQLEVTVGEGNLTFSEKRAMEYKKNRGKLGSVRLADEEPIDVKLDMEWDFLKASTGDTPTISDALKKRGEAAGWVSSDSDPCNPYAVDLVIVYTPDCEDVDSEEIVLPDFRYEQLDHDAKAGTISVTGKCNVTEAIITRLAA